MPLLDAPLPRMAGRLSFMRSACKTLDDVQPGDLAVIGLPVEDISAAHCGQSLAPRGLRETSVYFGWHANAQFNHPVDIDDRREISTAGMFERMCDLGDLRAPSVLEALADVRAILKDRRATAVFLGGNARLVEGYLGGSATPQIQLGGAGRGGCLTLAPVTGDGIAPDSDRSGATIDALLSSHIGQSSDACLRFDLSVFKSSLSGLCDTPRLGGCNLPEVARWMSAMGRSPVSSVFLTGLNPTLSGMGIIKTGQRLLVTALLSFIYAKLGAAHEDLRPVPTLEAEVL